MVVDEFVPTTVTVYVKLVALTQAIAYAPFHADSVAPEMVIDEPFAKPWFPLVITVAVVPLRVIEVISIGPILISLSGVTAVMTCAPL